MKTGRRSNKLSDELKEWSTSSTKTVATDSMAATESVSNEISAKLLERTIGSLPIQSIGSLPLLKLPVLRRHFITKQNSFQSRWQTKQHIHGKKTLITSRTTAKPFRFGTWQTAWKCGIDQGQGNECGLPPWEHKGSG